METIQIVSKIAIFFITWFFITYILKIIIWMLNDTKRRNRKEEARIIYKRREREFDYNDDQNSWKRWKHMNTEICDLVEGSYY